VSAKKQLARVASILALAAGVIGALVAGGVIFVGEPDSEPVSAPAATKTTRYHSISCGKTYDMGEEPTAADELEFDRCEAKAKAHEKAHEQDAEPPSDQESGKPSSDQSTLDFAKLRGFADGYKHGKTFALFGGAAPGDCEGAATVKIRDSGDPADVKAVYIESFTRGCLTSAN
jgi:hypothetical protein